MIPVLLLALSYGITGWTLVYILFSANGLLDFWPNFVNKHTSNVKIHKVLYMCPGCIAGQLALWTFPLFWWWMYDPAYHFIVVFVSIFFGSLLETLMDKLHGEQ